MNLLIIDDHPLFMDGVSQVLKQLADKVEVFKAHSIEEALTLLESKSDFDLILLDLSLPGMDGFSFLQRFSAAEFCIPVVVVSAEEQLSLIRRALQANVMGFVPKSLNASDMLSAFQSVLAGNQFLPDRITQMLSGMPEPVKPIPLPPHAQHAGISAKQYAVLILMAKGYSNQTIAKQLHRTEHTVKSHTAALFQILGVSNRTECVEVARNRGLISH
ncbi:MAG: response regulator transcription factor [Paraglaciecola sp.]|uniref:response regulator transcription factor n=1 Tax=Paraglaciecola sp. TaxID=1920173 RepID=UPI003296D838